MVYQKSDTQKYISIFQIISSFKDLLLKDVANKYIWLSNYIVIVTNIYEMYFFFIIYYIFIEINNYRFKLQEVPKKDMLQQISLNSVVVQLANIFNIVSNFLLLFKAKEYFNIKYRCMI